MRLPVSCDAVIQSRAKGEIAGYGQSGSGNLFSGSGELCSAEAVLAFASGRAGALEIHVFRMLSVTLSYIVVEVARSMATDRAALGSFFSGTGELCTAAAAMPRRRSPSRSARRRQPASHRGRTSSSRRSCSRRGASAGRLRGSGSRRGGGLAAELAPATQVLTLVAAHGGQRTEELLALRAVIQTSAIAAAPLRNASQDTTGHWVPPEQWARMPPELRAAASIVGERQRRSRRRAHGRSSSLAASPCSPPPRRHRGSRGNADAASPETERQRPRPGREELRPRPPAVLVEAITTVR